MSSIASKQRERRGHERGFKKGKGGGRVRDEGQGVKGKGSTLSTEWRRAQVSGCINVMARGENHAWEREREISVLWGSSSKGVGERAVSESEWHRKESSASGGERQKGCRSINTTWGIESVRERETSERERECTLNVERGESSGHFRDLLWQAIERSREYVAVVWLGVLRV
jgi:hypothetical protein